ncbi:MAG: asparagine synthase (glutamine-hydrolyzing) [Elusimicrobiales bacterium]
MCGICGFSGFRDDGLAREMASAMIHRGPDSDGFLFSDDVTLAMRRLRVIDLRSGNQPVYNENRRVCVVFNGEIYNHRALRRELEKCGHRFSTESDTEVIVHAYEEFGPLCVRKLEGMFAFALWDADARSLLLARDPLGIKPLYYYLGGGKLVFASELKALLKWRGLPRAMDHEAVDAYLNYLYIPEPRSIFKDVRKLEAGRIMLFSGGKAETRVYWRPPEPGSLNLSGEDALRYAEQLLEQTVKSHLSSDVPLGVFLSGGLDSGAVTAFAAKHSPGRLKTFSIGYKNPSEKSYDELDMARLVAKRYGTEHSEITVSPDITELIPRLAWHFDEPHADSGALVNYLIAAEARKHVTVALSGAGGDELFCGYPRYLGMKLYPVYNRLPASMRRAAAALADKLPESGKSRDLANWAKRFTRGAEQGPFECYNSWISFRGGHGGLYSPDFRAALENADPSAAHRAAFGAASGSLAMRAVQLDMQTYLPGDLLMMSDRMSMASSLELRVPFCDAKLAEFVCALPQSRRFGGFALKPLLRKILAPHLPAKVLSGRKKGFMVPLPLWLRGGMGELEKRYLSPETIKKRGLFNPAAVKAIIREHKSGARGNADLIWSLVMLEAWQQAYEDSAGTGPR